MIRAGKRSKDASPAGSRGSSLRGASAAEAQRTVLRLENDDWSDEEQAFELNEGEDMPEVAGIGLADLKPLDMAVVAQMMNSTLRKRSPRVRIYLSMHVSLWPVADEAHLAHFCRCCLILFFLVPSFPPHLPLTSLLL